MACINDSAPTTPKEIGDSISDTAPVGTITGIEYNEHQILAAERSDVISSLPDGNNEKFIANINDDFAKKQMKAATVFLGKIVFLRDAVYAAGAHFDGPMDVNFLEISDDGGSTLLIIGGILLDAAHKPFHNTATKLAITKETYILYT